MILLVIRNGVQFLRIVNILRRYIPDPSPSQLKLTPRSGHSIFNPPKPIDLSQARPSALDMDLDFSDDEVAAERNLAQNSILPLHSGQGGRRTLAGGRGGRYEGVYADEPHRDSSRGSSADREERRVPLAVRPGQGREDLTEEDQEAWDRLG